MFRVFVHMPGDGFIHTHTRTHTHTHARTHARAHARARVDKPRSDPNSAGGLKMCLLVELMFLVFIHMPGDGYIYTCVHKTHTPVLLVV